MVDTWLWDQGVPGSSPGCVRSTGKSWERLFTCISSPDYASQGVEKDTIVEMACRGPLVKRLKHFSWISAT